MSGRGDRRGGDGPPRTLMVFVDGLGIGRDDPALNPVVGGASPHLADLLARHAVPVDATLGVPGLPQSATGQTTLLTGVNAAVAIGRHKEGFPGPALRAIIREENLLSRLVRRGWTAAFANAYFMDEVSHRYIRQHPSVTTVAALAAFGRVRGPEEMLRGEAVCHDLTREGLRARGYQGPLLSPEESAAHLLRVARTQDFTLFEFFQTDRAGHRGDRALAEEVLRRFDRFLRPLVSFAARPGCLVVLTSDHGNIEDLSIRTHTTHPVPLAAVGQGAAHLLARMRTLEDFTPTLLELFPRRDGADGTDRG